MSRRAKLLLPVVVVAAVLAGAAVAARRALRRPALDEVFVPSPMSPPTPEPVEEPAPELPLASAVIDPLQPAEDQRRLRIAYVLTALAVVVILVAAGVVWLRPGHSTPARPIAGTPAATTASSTPLPLVVPNTSGPSCPDADPCHLTISAIKVNTSVAPKPTVMSWDPFLKRTVSSFGVPDDFTTTAWWSNGPLPGAAGMSVILGHHYSAGYGVFNDLGKLKNGDVIEVRVGQQVLDYRVDAIDGYLPKTDANALSDALSSRSSNEDLALISCTGAGDPASHQIVANVVVFAKLVAQGKVA